MPETMGPVPGLTQVETANGNVIVEKISRFGPHGSLKHILFQYRRARNLKYFRSAKILALFSSLLMLTFVQPIHPSKIHHVDKKYDQRRREGKSRAF